MTHLSKNLKAVVMRNGIIIWKEAERLNNLAKLLNSSSETKYITVDEELINTADVTGIFTPETMDAHQRRRNGQWQCNVGRWHDRGEKCECVGEAEQRYARLRNEAISKCGKCMNGYVPVKVKGKKSNSVKVCDCVLKIEHLKPYKDAMS